MQTWPVNLPIIFCGLPQTCHRPNSRCCCRVGCLPYGGLVSRRSWVQLSVTGVLDSYWGYSSSVRSSERYEIVPGSCLTVWRRCSCRERQDQSLETHLEYGILSLLRYVCLSTFILGVQNLSIGQKLKRGIQQLRNSSYMRSKIQDWELNTGRRGRDVRKKWKKINENDKCILSLRDISNMSAIHRAPFGHVKVLNWQTALSILYKPDKIEPLPVK